LKGHRITVFEALSAPGGMLKWGIPDYRLPAAVLDVEIKSAVLDLGVELKLNSPVGDKVKLSDLRKEGYKAFFLAIGAHKGLKLDIPGESEFPLPLREGEDEGERRSPLPLGEGEGEGRSLHPLSGCPADGVCSNGVMDAVRFLRMCKAGKVKGVRGRVAVIGGGNVAIDAARSAWRLGASEVRILYRRSRAEMPANPWEVEEAEHEGVKIEYLVAPVKLVGDRAGSESTGPCATPAPSATADLTGIECIRMELGAPDASGRRRPVPVKGSEFIVGADIVIPAIGQQPESRHFGGGKVCTARNGTFTVDTLTLQTGEPDVFAGGDAVLGPATAIEAIAAGQRAAESIHRFLTGQSLTEGREVPAPEPAKKDTAGVTPAPRTAMRSVPVEKRRGNFDEVELGFSEEEAVAEAQRCLNCAVCCECLKCVEACEAKAIRHEMIREETVELRVGAVIAAPGFELFNPDEKKELGYDRYANVITALEFERILSASGPFTGKIQRLSDGAHPGKIAFVQCVGSRETGHDYCSSVCCMYAIKQAVIAKEHEPGLECHVFFIDIRAFGKGFDEYYVRARELGVKFRRCRPSSIKETPATKNPIVRYSAEDDKLVSEEFDIVVLSAGLRPPADAARLAAALGIELDEHGFARTPHFQPVRSTRPGVFVCGPFTEPKDIPETVMQASGSAACAMALLAEKRNTLVERREYPPEKDVSGEPPRVGVFVCHCGKNIGGVANVPDVVKYAAGLADVAHAEDNLYTCSADTQQHIKEMIEKHGLNRVVVASCTPRTHEPLFQDTIRAMGLNPYLFEMANIRDQCTWVHMQQPADATAKSKDLVRMAVAKARRIQPLPMRKLPVTKDALVVGGGLAGMTAALALADQGFKTHLVERETELGGNLKHIFYLAPYESAVGGGRRETGEVPGAPASLPAPSATESTDDPQALLHNLIDKVSTHPKIVLHKATRVIETSGFYGNFVTKLASSPLP
ncbi:MAG: FAD-dependent oxidoreductase, partial [Planctomycetota bacterium]|nr:FAD-dependent oxidoreductase [Planctomycetota bacterium]